MSVIIFCATENNFIPLGDFVTSLLNLMYLFHFVIDKFTELPSESEYSITEGYAHYYLKLRSIGILLFLTAISSFRIAQKTMVS